MKSRVKKIISHQTAAGQKLLENLVSKNNKSEKTETALNPIKNTASELAQPVISVIVPCYNVTKFVSETLNSILHQKNIDLEIIAVNDGSTDNTLEILRSFEQKFSNLRVIDQANAGLGAARNAGVRAASCDYITFIDSDDTIPPESLSTMVSTLQKSGSDFAIGTMERRQGNRRWVPDWAKSVHASTRFGAQLADDLEVLKDVFACNKVFRKDFFDRVIGAFPEGIRYEDQEPTAKAYIASNGFDVLSDIVYTWVIREDGTSITQQKSSINDLIDRLEVLNRVHSVLKDSNREDVLKYWYVKSLAFDFKPYYDQILRTDDEYWNVLSNGLAPFFSEIDESAWRKFPFWDRMNALAIARGSKDDIAIIASSRQELGSGYELNIDGENISLSADFIPDLSFSIAQSELLIDMDVLKPKVELRDLVWTSDNKLSIAGTAWIPGLGTNRNEYTLGFYVAPRNQTISAQAVEQITNLDRILDGSLAIEHARVEVIDPELAIGDAYNTYNKSGFTAELDLKNNHFDFFKADTDTTWQIVAAIKLPNCTFLTPFTSVNSLGRASNLELGKLVSDRRFAPRFIDNSGLVLNEPTSKPIMRFPKISDGLIEFAIDNSKYPGASQVILRSRNRPDLIIDSYKSSDGLLNFRFDASILLNASSHELIYEVRLKHRHTSYLVQFDGGSQDADSIAHLDRRLCFDLSPNGFVRLRSRSFGSMVTFAEVDEASQSLVIRGTLDKSGADEIRFNLASDTRTVSPAQSTFNDSTGEFSLSFDLSINADSVLSVGAYSLRANPVSALAAGHKVDYWVPVDRRIHQAFPKYALVPGRLRLRIAKTKQAKALWINSYIPLDDIARSKKFGRQLTNGDVNLVFTNDRITNSTLFESFAGNTISDSPKALFEWAKKNSRGGELVWALKDGSLEAPAGSRSVVINSPEYVKLLHTSKTLVNNNNFPFYFRKNDGQFYLQTWHGTPLKRIGNDVPSTSLSISYRRLMKREAEYWDALLAQNEFAASKFGPAFGFDGPIWIEGYPRNDSLVDSRSSAQRRATRREFGIRDDQVVMLYAPTWRDNQKTSSNHYDLVTYLDFERVAKKFGDSAVILSRGHMNTLNSGRSVSGSNVIDVSKYPDVNDLILASDCLVGDYSSIMFDYVTTGKPVFVLAPDIDLYGGDLRGFYYDFKNNAPGPICATTGELLGYMTSGFYQTIDQTYSYRKEFAPMDDGLASDRVGKMLWQS